MQKLFSTSHKILKFIMKEWLFHRTKVIAVRILFKIHAGAMLLQRKALSSTKETKEMQPSRAIILRRCKILVKNIK